MFSPIVSGFLNYTKRTPGSGPRLSTRFSRGIPLRFSCAVSSLRIAFTKGPPVGPLREHFSCKASQIRRACEQASWLWDATVARCGGVRQHPPMRIEIDVPALPLNLTQPGCDGASQPAGEAAAPRSMSPAPRSAKETRGSWTAFHRLLRYFTQYPAIQRLTHCALELFVPIWSVCV